MSKLIIGLSGRMGSGKDTVANMIKEKFQNVEILHFSDALKNICLDVFNCTYQQVYGQEKEVEFFTPLVITHDHILELMYWIQKSRVIPNYKNIADNAYSLLSEFIGKEMRTPRQLMQLLGTEMIRGCFVDSYHIDYTDLRVTLSTKDIILIPDVRFFNEKEWLRSKGGIAVLVVGRQREKYHQYASHASESELAEDQDYDYVLNNTGTLEILNYNVDSMFKDLPQGLSDGSIRYK